MNELQATWIEVSRTPDRRASRHHQLVMQAIGLPYGALEIEGQHVIVVRSDFAARARDELARYERENVGWPPRERAHVPISQGIHAAIVYCGVMLLFFIFQSTHQYGLDWSSLGRADAGAIRSGEWWRAFTALSLHVDLPHVAGNMVFGAAFGVILAQSIGVGLAWCGFLLSGALGNYLNAWFQDPSHRSMGASTAVFGALGLQVAYEWMKRGQLKYRAWRRWAPLIMGGALLAWLGTGSASMDDPKHLDAALERVDVMAHVFGFAAGVVLGVLLGWYRGSLWMRARSHVLLTGAALATLVLCWILAIAHG